MQHAGNELLFLFNRVCVDFYHVPEHVFDLLLVMHHILTVTGMHIFVLLPPRVTFTQSVCASEFFSSPKVEED